MTTWIMSQNQRDEHADSVYFLFFFSTRGYGSYVESLLSLGPRSTFGVAFRGTSQINYLTIIIG